AWEAEEYYVEDKTSWADDEEYNEDAEAYGEDGEEYYEDEEAYETDEEEYYGDEEAYEADEEERYEDEESYEIDDDTYYEDEEVYEADEEEYYEDEEAYEADEEEYYEDEEAYKADEEEYYGDEEIYASDDGYYEDDEEDYDDDEYYEIDDEDDDYDDDEEAPEGGIGKVVYRITHMSAVDYIITLTSAAVLILAIVTGTMYLGAKSSQAQLETFAEIGVGLEDIDMIGGSGLVAIADAQASKLAAAELEIEQEQEQEEEKKKEQEKAGNIEVVMNLTSIQKDLKIKFINKKTGKLIPNIGFEVEVKTPSGSAVTYKDDDKDGIIYKTDMEPGKYTIKIISPASGSEYQISTEETAITVRDKIEYKKVDVSDEVKTEAQVNAAVEDTKVNETVVESTNTDTVEWVESTKTLIDGTEETEEGYEKIDRSSIADPAQQASAGFRLLTGIEDREPKEGDSQNPPPTAEPAPTEKPEPDPTAAPTEKPADAPPT
ncbi:MAG: hypothetical protein K2G19_03680, partial [Lachnospiraceae bacterium]|nr:hypothetical protein [Lachnospiraceae bacterium]